MNFKIWTPRYILNRTKVAIRHKFNRDEPWLTGESIDFLNSYLDSSDIGLEWGSGRSTIWFAKKVMQLTSIETNEIWFNTVKELLTTNKLNNVNLKLRPEEPAEEYLDTEGINDESLDFVLVDGMIYRHLAALVSIPLLKTNGLLIIDNINWFIPSPYGNAPSSVSKILSEWESIYDNFKNWRCFWTSDGVTDTAIWFKS